MTSTCLDILDSDSSLISSQDFQREKEIWKEIDEIQMIVGVEKNPELNYAEEVQDLYMFLGIESPTSPDDSFYLKNVEDQIHFLKSIIGVK